MSKKVEGRYCYKFGVQMNTWDVRLTNIFKVYDTCESCFCKIYDMDQDTFRNYMDKYLDERPCQGL